MRLGEAHEPHPLPNLSNTALWQQHFDYGNATKIYLWYLHRTVTDAVYTILYMLNVYV